METNSTFDKAKFLSTVHVPGRLPDETSREYDIRRQMSERLAARGVLKHASGGGRKEGQQLPFRQAKASPARLAWRRVVDALGRRQARKRTSLGQVRRHFAAKGPA